MPPSRRAISAPRSRLMLRLLEIPQIGRRLSLSGGHQVAVTAYEVCFAGDADMVVALGANGLVPNRLLGLHAPDLAGHGPWAGQRMIDRGDLIINDFLLVPPRLRGG